MTPTSRTNKEQNPMSTQAASANPPDPDQGVQTYTRADGERRVAPGTWLRLVWDMFAQFPDTPISVAEMVDLLADYNPESTVIAGAMRSFAWPSAAFYGPGYRKTSPATASGVKADAPGVVYHDRRGSYVYDTGAKVYRGKLRDNTWPCWKEGGVTILADPPPVEAEPEPVPVAEIHDLPSTLKARLDQLKAMQPPGLQRAEAQPPSTPVSELVSGERPLWEPTPEPEAEGAWSLVPQSQHRYTIQVQITEDDGPSTVIEQLDLGEFPSLVLAIVAWHQRRG